MNEVIEHQMPEPQTAVEVKTQIKAIQEVLHGVMKKDVHYGVIPGTQKPTLYKAGSEVLLATFRIAVDCDIEDLSVPDCIRYRVSARGMANARARMGGIEGNFVGAGVGEASTDEERYKWKSAGKLEFDNTNEDRRRIKYGWKWGQERGVKIDTETHQVRTNPADLGNTVLKMAKKRAQVDLCLTALAASDVFDQDMEDAPEVIREQTVNPKAQSTAPASTPTDGKASEAQIKLLKVKSDQAGVREVDVWVHLGVGSWGEITWQQVNECLDWLKTVQP